MTDTLCNVFPQLVSEAGGRVVSRGEGEGSVRDQQSELHVPPLSESDTRTSEMVRHKTYLLTLLCSLSLAEATTLADFLYQRLRKG